MAHSSFTQSLVPVAQVIGLTGSALLSGLIASVSYVSIPTLLIPDLPPSLAAKIWKRTYDIGSATAPPLAITCAACFGFLASQSPGPLARDLSSPMTLYTISSFLIPSVVPYTLVLMKPTNERLMVKAEQGEKAAISDGEARELLAKWRSLNYGRAVMVLTGSVLASVATIVVR